MSGLAPVFLAPAALPTKIGPYAAVMALGLLIGVTGHVIRSRLLIIVGIAIVGGLSIYIVFGLAKIY